MVGAIAIGNNPMITQSNDKTKDQRSVGRSVFLLFGTIRYGGDGTGYGRYVVGVRRLSTARLDTVHKTLYIRT